VQMINSSCPPHWGGGQGRQVREHEGRRRVRNERERERGGEGEKEGDSKEGKEGVQGSKVVSAGQGAFLFVEMRAG
jgi:hypothetical protein